ncbi:MAG: SDR family NAD(P)-dependent oxidoreductase [Rhizobiales bacterium]|nr:SDR family NAD(P)-dependent oxidoreductase [Hyphomicrobiales bacterium]
MASEPIGKSRTALITGASAGIGREIALVFASEGFHLVLVARRKDRLEALAQETKGKYGVETHIIAADLSDPATPRRLFDDLAAQHIMIDALVNNAGYSVTGYFRDTKWADQAGLIQVMVTSYAELCHLFGPGMAARGYGRIINVASLAGHLPGAAGGTLYAAAKSFVIKMSESLSLENIGNNVHVTALCPGFTYSEFHDVAGNREQMNKLPKFIWMTGDVVARQAYDAVMEGRPVIINGRINNFIALLARLLPQRLVHGLMARNKRNAVARTKTENAA